MSMDATTILGSFLRVVVVVLLRLSATTSSSGPSVDHDYSRWFPEVTRHCQSLLSSSSEKLSVEAEHGGHLIRHLSFTDGDWSQDAGHGPLFPFHGSSAGSWNAAGHELREAARLASFRVTHVQAERRGAFNVSGLLTFTETGDVGLAEFQAPFEGVYTETPSAPDGGGGGERVLCMVGNTALPWRGGNGTDFWDSAKKNGGGETSVVEPPSAAAANMLLVLRYPMAHTLTTRAVRGEMTSLSAGSDGAYFDAIRLVSRLGPYSSYLLQAQELGAAGCSSRPSLRDGDVPAGHLYRGASFCEILRRFATSTDYVSLALVPNWKCNSTDEFCSRPGPFDASGRAATMPFTRSAITVQDLRCAPARGTDGTAAAIVAAVFRFVAPWEDPTAVARRTGLSGATLSAEGAWSASTGRLCMPACLGAGREACRYRVTLHVTSAFSITRRSIVVGEITAMDGSHYPLSFQSRVPTGQDWHQFGRSGEDVPVAYHYTTVEQAGELLRRSKLSILRDNFIARSLLSYPQIAGAADDLASLSNLAGHLDNVGLQSPKLSFVPEWIDQDAFHLELQILSIGTLVGRYSYSLPFKDGSSKLEEQADGVESMAWRSSMYSVLNVSAELTAFRVYLDPVPVMSLEGVYNPEDGRMSLIGCRNVHAPWRDLSRSRDLEDGLDCSIEVTVQYPPTTMRWLINPVAKVAVSSTREDDDPLHFSRAELQSMLVFYPDHQNTLSEHTIEALLCIAVLSAAIAATVSQLNHINSHAGVAPYVSLVMLGVQALGYGASLVTDAKILPAWPRQSVNTYTDTLESSVRALTLAALVVTLWLAHKVWWSKAQARAGAGARSTPVPGRVPRDGAVLVLSLAVHLGGLFVVLAVCWRSAHSTSAATRPPRSRQSYEEEAQSMPSSNMYTLGDALGIAVEGYFAAVKEWFLLPQVIGNALWRVNCKPLAVRYYVGVTAAWLLPHVYGYIRPPLALAYMYANHDDLYSKAGAMVVPVVGVALALIVFVQQRGGYKNNAAWATKDTEV